MNWRRWVPAGLRLQLRRSQRGWHDLRTGHAKLIASDEGHYPHWPKVAETVQRINPGTHFAGKLENFRVAGGSINQRVVGAGEIFSFWGSVPRPTVRNGYKKGRNLINGVLTESVGGGLCQLAGILYHTGLQAGLHMMERYNHSVDIYTEEERYSPLGADATVVFGYKDLRMRNPHPYPIQFQIATQEGNLHCSLHCPEPLQAQPVTFIRQPHEQGEAVITKVGEEELYTSVYRKLC